MTTYKCDLEKSRIWLDKQITVDDYTVDGFTVDSLCNHTAEIVFFRWEKLSADKTIPACELPAEVRERGYIKVIQKRKIAKFIDGKIVISIDGCKYQIGGYEII